MGLRVKLYLPLLLLSALLASYIYGIWMPRSLEDAERGYRSLLEKHLDNVADGLVPLMLGRQLDAVYGDLDHLLKENSDWLDIQLFDADGRSLYPLDATPAAKAREARNVIILKQEIRHGDADLGKLLVTVDFTLRLNELKRRNEMLVSLLLAVVLLFLLTSGFVLERVVRRPIKRLADASKRLAAGDYTANLPKTGADEIGTLVKSFVEMRDAVRLHAGRLMDANEQLRREVAERARVEEALRTEAEFSRTVMDSINDGISIVDVSDYRITGCNAGFLKKLGLRREDVVGRHCYEVTHRRNDPCRPPLDICPLEKTAATGKYSTDEHVHFLEAGNRSYIEVSTTPVFDEDGNVVKVVHLDRDITERKQAEEDVRRLNAELELKVEERTKQLLDAQDELVRKEKLATLGQLAGTVGHELRNPLGVMNNAVYFLQTVLADADETTKEYLGLIKSEIAGAERIVSDLLDAVRTKPPHPQRLLAEDLIRMILEKCRIPEHVTVEVMSATRRSVLIDPLQMKQAFINLINNAVDAMPEGGTLKITADEEKNAELVRFAFKDEGVGISSENVAKLFQPLFTTKARGIGLGLVVVKNLTEANGGRVDVESEPGKGTTFTITLPTADAKMLQAQQQQ